LGLVGILVSYKCQVNKEAPKSTDKWRNHSDSAKYVGIQTCKKCHEDIYKTYIQTGMGQSFGKADTLKSAGNFHQNKPIYDRFADFYYYPSFKGNKLYIKEYRIGKDGDTTYSREEKIDYIVGSGHHTNSHIINTNGYLNQAPFTFYVQKKKWDLPPGFENGFNSRFNRALGLECISCHNSLPEFVEGSLNKFTKIPEGINCERCHGPGSIHASEKAIGLIVNTKLDTDFSIVNPKKLPYKLQIDICQRCHLQGNTVLKDGKSFFDFRPGMELKSVMDVYLPSYEDDNNGFLMAAHAERLKKSKCFITLNTNGKEGFNCITCHNPHVSVKNLEKDYFNNKCKNCHNQAENKTICTEKIAVRNIEKDNCVKCHMPLTGAVDIPHVSIHDHFIKKWKKGEKDVPKTVGAFKGLKCLNNTNPDYASLAQAYLYFYEKFEHKSYLLDSALIYINKLPSNLIKNKINIHYSYLRNDFDRLIKYANGIKNPGLLDGYSLYQIGEAYFNKQDFKSAELFLSLSIDKEKYQLDYINKYVVTLIINKKYENAKKYLDFLIQENPKNAVSYNHYALYYLNRGELSQSEDYIKKSLKIDPDLLEAHFNLAKIYYLSNKMINSKRELNFILAKHPENLDAKQLLKKINS